MLYNKKRLKCYRERITKISHKQCKNLNFYYQKFYFLNTDLIYSLKKHDLLNLIHLGINFFLAKIKLGHVRLDQVKL